MRYSIPFLLMFALLGCGEDDEALSYSEPVAINLKAKSGEAVNGVATAEKNINTETGNPYAAFIKDAEAKLGKTTPSRIEVQSLSLLLGANSKGVATLGEVFTGEVRVDFVIENNTAPVGALTIDAEDGAGPLEIPVVFDSTTLASAIYDKLVAGDFKVVLTGPVAADFESKGAEADLQVSFGFAAFE